MRDDWDQILTGRVEQVESHQDRTFWQVFVPTWHEVAAAFSPRQRTRVLELGVGTGHLTRELCHNFGRMHCLDASRTAVDVASKILQEHPQVEVVHGDLFHHKGGPYTACISHMVLHTIPDVDEAFGALWELLEDGAVFCFSLPHPCFYRGHRKEIKDLPYEQDWAATLDFTISSRSEVLGTFTYYHRPLHRILNGVLHAGFQLRRILEPVPSPLTELKAEWPFPRYMLIEAEKPIRI